MILNLFFGTPIGCLAYLIIQQGEEIKNSGINSFWKNLVSLVLKYCISFNVKNDLMYLQKGTPPKMIFVVCNFLLLACVGCRAMMWDPKEEHQYRILEEAFLVFSVPGSWFYMIFFCG